MPLVWFIRHGESEANAGLATSFPTDIKLTSDGFKQAKYIYAKFFKDKLPSLIIPSKYERSIQTAQPTIRHYREALDDKEWPVHEFTYLSPSKVAYTTVEDRREQVEAYWKHGDPNYRDGDGAESFVDFMKRVYDVVKRLQSRHEERIAVFSHGQFIAAAHWLLKEYPGLLNGCSVLLLKEWLAQENRMREFRNFLKANLLPNGAILPVELNKRKPQIEEVITDHLPSMKNVPPPLPPPVIAQGSDYTYSDLVHTRV